MGNLEAKVPVIKPELCHSNHLLDYIVQKDVRIRAVVGVTCSLSIIGSLLIIFSYVCFRDLRTRARYILVHLSLMDLILAVSNLVGIAGNFDQRSIESNSNYTQLLPTKFKDTIYCRIQGLFTLYSTLSSILWTILLALFVFILVTAGNPKRITKFLMLFCYLLCYGLPLLPSLWAFLRGKVGYAPLQSSGWCALKSHYVYVYYNTSAMNGSDDHFYCVSEDIYTNFFAYNLWIMMAFCVIGFTYLSVHCHINNKDRDKMIALKTDKHAEDYWEVMNNIDYKFAAIPIAFILIRIWSLCSDIIYVYVGLSPKHLPPSLVYILMYLLGIGNSAQGFIDAIIFVVFTQQVRKNMIVCFFQWLRPKRSHLIINSDVNRSILDKSHRHKRYQVIKPAMNSDDITGKLKPTTSVTTNYSDLRVSHESDTLT